eukprot:5695471-Prymnesium_polylepis.1
MFVQRVRLVAAAGAAALALRTRAEAIEGHFQVDRFLDTLYADLPDVHDVPADEIRVIDESGGHEAYGELTVKGVREVMTRLGVRPGDVVADLGSGCGRMVLQCALEWPSLSSVLGVELSASRHGVAAMALRRCEETLGPGLTSKVRLYEDDMLSATCAAAIDDVTIMYVASLLFDDDFMARLGGVLAARPRLRAVATLTRFPPDALPGFQEDGARRCGFRACATAALARPCHVCSSGH